MKISILIPCYNEEKTLRDILLKVINFENEEYTVPVYTSEILENEAKLFFE